MEVPSICPCGNEETILQDQAKGCEGFYFVLGQILQRKCQQDDQYARALSTRERSLLAHSTTILQTQTVSDDAASLETDDNRKKNLIAKVTPVTNNTVPAPPPLQLQLSFDATTSQTVPTVDIAAAVADFHKSGQKLRSVKDARENGRLVRRKHSSSTKTRTVRRSESMSSSPGSPGGYQVDPDSSSGEDHKSMMEEALKKRIPAVYGATEPNDAEDAEDWKEHSPKLKKRN